jgi:hypothetical protein
MQKARKTALWRTLLFALTVAIGAVAPVAQAHDVICADGTISHSGGKQGACSHHGGIAGGSSSPAVPVVTPDYTPPTLSLSPAASLPALLSLGSPLPSLVISVSDDRPLAAVNATLSWADGTSDSVSLIPDSPGGSSGTLTLPAHTYTSQGTYSATVSVDDASNNPGTLTLPAVTVMAPPGIVSLPRVVGTMRAGRTVSCQLGTWSNGPTQFAVQWLASGAPIRGATGASLGISRNWAGRLLSCQVSAANAAGTASAISVARRVARRRH